MNQRRRIVRVLRVVMPALGIASAVLLAPWDGLWAWMRPLPDTVQEQVDIAIGHGLDGIVVYVDAAGEPPAFYAAGWKDRDDRSPADPRSLFKIASIDKLYVAVAATKLVADERLSLDDTLADLRPELVGRIENAQSITLRAMLQHRSGIPNYVDHPDWPWGEPPQTGGEALAYALDLPADFAPDASYGYSNTNYLLLAEIIEDVVGYSHHRVIDEEILQPLGLDRTYASLRDVDADDVMSGYAVGWGPDLKGIHYGSMIATAEDVGAFVRALNDGSLLDGDEQAIYSSVYEYGHSGLLPGYQSIARYHRELDTVVVQFVNTIGGAPLLPVVDVGGGTKVMVANVVYDRIVRILRNETGRDR